MKLTILFLISCCLQVAAASHAQQITLSEKDAPLEKVFKDITKQTGYIFFTEKNTLQGTNKVTLTLTNASLNETLQKVFAGQPLDYTIAGTTIAVKKKEVSQPTTKKSAQTAPPTDVIGRVTTTQGQPLSGATIYIKRTQQGTLTDANGNFTVRDVNPADTLIIGYIGYGRTYISVGNQTNFKIMLKESTNQLDQVVIQAYGQTSQRLATGNIGGISAKDIEKQPVSNVLEALQGQVAGVIVTQTNGSASAPIKVEIRGRNSLANVSSDPLYIIDGVPLTVLDVNNISNYGTGSPGFANAFQSPVGGQSPEFSLNPSDIASIEVLKDADATAIYGSKAANGVILITTKKGKIGKTHPDVSVYEGVSEVGRHFQLLNTQQYIEMRTEALKNDGIPVDINSAPDLVYWNTERYTNWPNYLWGGLGKVTDAETSLSGGDNQTTFRIGAGYHNQTDITSVSGENQRGSLSFNLTHSSVDQKFTVSLTGEYSYSFVSLINMPPGAGLPPDAPSVFDSNGKLNFNGWAPRQAYFPFGTLLQPYSSKTNFLNSNLGFNYQIFKGLSLKTNVGYNNMVATQINFQPITSQNPQYNPTGSSTFGYNFNHNLIVEPTVEYNGFVKQGKLNVLLGGSIQNTSGEGLAVTGAGYTNDLLLPSLNAAPAKYTNDVSAQDKYAAIFGRINYNWEDKYIINLNGRRDGSSRFGPGRQYGNFASVGAAWIFSEEKWIKDNIHFLSFGKLRSSYGTTGNDQIGDYQFLTQWNFLQAHYNGLVPVIPIKHTDSLLHWEVDKKLEVALDLGILNDRVTVEASWYRARCNDQLISLPTPVFTGFSFVQSNSPADVQNEGFEFLLNTKIVDNKDFKWSAKFNIGLNRNKLISYPDFPNSPYSNIYVIGQSLNITKVLHYTGVDPETGLYTFEDKNKDGKISIDYTGRVQDDRYIVNLSPKYDGGFTNSFSYKNWDLTFFFYFKKQLGYNALSSFGIPGGINNQPLGVLSRWQKPGDITTVGKFTTNPSDPSYNSFANSDAYITDASFIRLKNVSLSYTIPESVSQKLGIVSGHIFVRGENLILITSYKGVDPETQSYGQIPVPRIFTAGISCNF